MLMIRVAVSPFSSNLHRRRRARFDPTNVIPSSDALTLKRNVASVPATSLQREGSYFTAKSPVQETPDHRNPDYIGTAMGGRSPLHTPPVRTAVNRDRDDYFQEGNDKRQTRRLQKDQRRAPKRSPLKRSSDFRSPSANRSPPLGGPEESPKGEILAFPEWVGEV